MSAPVAQPIVPPVFASGRQWAEESIVFQPPAVARQEARRTDPAPHAVFEPVPSVRRAESSAAPRQTDPHADTPTLLPSREPVQHTTLPLLVPEPSETASAVVQPHEFKTGIVQSRAGMQPQPRRVEPLIPAEASSQAQIVRVSIGRVDVRAEFSPATPARVRRPEPAPTLSLEQYRKQRDGGLR